LINHTTTVECAADSFETARQELLKTMRNFVTQREDVVFRTAPRSGVVEYFSRESRDAAGYLGKMYIESPIQIMD
jgi:hypothetical protein